MSELLFPAVPVPVLPVRGRAERVPIRRIFCVGRNYEAHAKEMGSTVDREAPFYFTKAAEHYAPSGATAPYPLGTSNYHYELELVVDSMVTFALSDALEAWRERSSRTTGPAPRVIPIAPKLVRDLLAAGRALQAPSSAGAGGASGTMALRIERASSLRDVVRSLERQTFEQLYAAHAGDFRAMAGALLGKTDAHAARQVLLRFNQLGLRVRKQRG